MSGRREIGCAFGAVARLASRLAFRGICLVSIAALGLTGCSNINGFLEPVPAFSGAPGTTHVEMVVATTRTRAESPAVMFSGGRAPEPGFADMVVSIPPDANRKIGEVQWPKQLPGNPEIDFVTLKADVISKDQAIATFARLLRESNKSEAMVFVHGFNERYDDTVYGFAQISCTIPARSAKSRRCCVTWPSKGNVFAYGYDRESSNYSRDSLEALLRFLVKESEGQENLDPRPFDGNWVTLEALRQMAIRDGRVAAKIKLVLLADPDVDVDVSREQIAAMGPDRPHIALFVSEDDQALAASKEVGVRRGWVPSIPYRALQIHARAGEYHRHQPHQTTLTRRIHHGKFAEDPKVVELIGRSLASGQALTYSRVGFGQKIMQTTASAATSVGHAAGLVVSGTPSPLSIRRRGIITVTRVDQFTQSVHQIGPEQKN